jgi:hypothetical protein
MYIFNKKVEKWLKNIETFMIENLYLKTKNALLSWNVEIS